MSNPTQGDWVVSIDSYTKRPSVRAGGQLVVDQIETRRWPHTDAPFKTGDIPLMAMSKVLRHVLESIANYPCTDESALSLMQTLARAVDWRAANDGIGADVSPAPWRVGQSPFPRFRRDILDANGLPIACCTTQANKVEEVVANAHLMARAPEMIDAVRAIATFPSSHPEKAANTVQIIALTALYPNIDFSAAVTAEQAREIAGIKTIETPYESELERIRARFDAAMPGPWKYGYVSSTHGTLSSAAPERVFAFLANVSKSNRLKMLAAPTVHAGILKAIDALKHLTAEGDAGSQAYALRLLRSLTQPETALWRAEQTAGEKTYEIINARGLPIGRVANVGPGDLALLIATPNLIKTLTYVVSALEAIEEKAESRKDREYASSVLGGDEGLRSVLNASQGEARPGTPHTSGPGF